MATLTRQSSGLLLRDDFSTDTSADYDAYGITFAVEDGKLSMDISASGPIVRKAINGALCVTTRVAPNNDSNYCGGPALWQHSPIDAAADVDGYTGCKYGTTNAYSLPFTDNVLASLGYQAVEGWTKGVYWQQRLYRDGPALHYRFGPSGLVSVISGDDATYTSGLYPGVYCRYQTLFDYLDARTSHLITCTGLPTGYWFKVADAVLDTGTEAKAQESGGTATVDAGAVLFPLYWVGVFDGDPDDGGNLVTTITNLTLSDMGGGDVFAYSGSTKPPMGMCMRGVA